MVICSRTFARDIINKVIAITGRGERLGNSRKHRVRAILVVTIVSILLFSASYSQFAASASLYISINNGAPYATSTDVSLTLDYDVQDGEMCFSNDDVSWTEWESYSSSRTWTLTPGEGDKTVYAQFRSNFMYSIKDSDTILLDTTPPSLTILSPVDDAYVKSSGFIVSGTATDGDGSGVDKVEVKVDNGKYVLADGSTSWSVDLSALSDRHHTIYVKVTDRAGLFYENSVDVEVDGIAPATDLDFAGTLGLNGWYTTAVTAALTATDSGGSGVKEIHYILDGGTKIVPGEKASISISTTEIHNLSFWAVDNADNNEAPRNTEVKIDLTPPTTTASLSGTKVPGETNWYTGTVKVTLSTSDSAGSGVANTYYKLDGDASDQVYTDPRNIDAMGTTNIYYYSVDKAGNKEPTKTIEVNIAYPVKFTANGLPAGTSWSVTLDGTTQSSNSPTITFLSKTVPHNWNVTKAISGGTGIQYTPLQHQGIIDVSLQTAVAISYVQQYYLTVTSAYGNPTGAGWYDSGSTANFTLTSPVSISTGSRYAFTNWTGDLSSQSPSGSIPMNSAKNITANWQTQYQVTFAVTPAGSGTTSPSGAIWVDAGNEVSPLATAASSNNKFSSWTSSAGAISNSTSPSTTITVTGSGTVTANFEQIQTQEPTPTANPTSNPTQGQNTTPRPTAKPTVANPTPTPTVTVVPSNFVSKSILASASDGSSTYLTIYGNIDDSEISNAILTKDQNTPQTTLSLTLIGQSGANNFCNLTVPRRAITSDTVPTVYINNQIVNNQGYLQDNNYFYVWYNTYLNTYDLSVVFSGKSDFPLWPIGIVIGVSIALVAGIVTPRLKSKGNNPLKTKNEFVVSDYVISDGVLKFYNRPGLLQNKLVQVREIPISTISNIEHFWNELTITWNNVIDTFRKKKNYESFNEEVTAKVQAIMDENKRALEKQEKIYLRNTNVEEILNDTLPVVDVVFDVLSGLHAKRVDWTIIEDTVAVLGQSINLTTQSLPTLTLDFTQLSIAISKQDPREVANQARVVLKAILEYFNRLRPMDTVPDAHPNLDEVAMLVNSYYLLNDIMLGKLVSQKENPREIHSLERSIQKLSKDTTFKMDLEDLRTRIGSLNVDQSDTEDVIGDTRELYKDQILQLYSA